MANKILSILKIQALIITVLRCIVFGVNLIALVGGIVYLIYPIQYMLWNLYGFVILPALVMNIISAGVGKLETGKAGSGRVSKPMDYCYLIVSIVSMLLIPLINTIASSNPQNLTSQSLFVLILYNIIFLFGTLSAGLRLREAINMKRLPNPNQAAQELPELTETHEPQQAHRKELLDLVQGDKPQNSAKKDKQREFVETAPKKAKSRSVVRRILMTLLYAVMLFGIFITYIMVVRSTSNMIEVFISPYSVFWGLFFLSNAVLIFKLERKKRRAKKGEAAYTYYESKSNIAGKAAYILGIIIFMIHMLPLASVPSIIRQSDMAFREAFGEHYLDDLTAQERQHLMTHPFSLQDYFFGTRTSGYVVIENILFHEGVSGIDEGIRLYFDVYMPKIDDNNLPGQNSVLIRIHGGAWVMGDKGSQNYAAINKHFARQGYVVFDIQYGLNNQNPSLINTLMPNSKMGNFDIDDMVRHIGIFTTFLAENADEFNANLDSVFFTGGSAGGQLASAAALGITSGRFTHMLDSRLNVRGLIPVYPANGLAPFVGIGGSPDLVDPVALIDNNSPPSLILHGTHDGIVNPMVAEIMLREYRNNSSAPSALLLMDFAAHGTDIHTSGYYNQIFMYYMERFMLQFR